MVFATVPAAPPTEKNHRATSWPPPISANVPYVVASRLSASAFCRVPEAASSMERLLQWALVLPIVRHAATERNAPSSNRAVPPHGASPFVTTRSRGPQPPCGDFADL